MIHRPSFKSHFQVEVVPPDRVFLVSESDRIVVEGRLYALLAPFIDGRNTVQDIVDCVEGRANVLDVRFGLSMLEEERYIIETDDETPAGLAAFRDLLDVDVDDFKRRLRDARVRVTSFGDMPTEEFATRLETMDIHVREDGDLWVALVDDYLRPELVEVNRRALEEKRAWMIVKPVGSMVWIGPIFTPGQPPCWECLSARLKEHRSSALQEQEGREKEEFYSHPIFSLEPSIHAGLNMAATQVFRWVVQADGGGLKGQVVTYDVVSMKSETHLLFQRPNCSHCGGTQRRADPVPILLESRKKIFKGDGGLRSVSPELTLRKFKPHVSPITGIVPRLESRQVERSDLVHVYGAELVARSVTGMRRALRNKCAGKGMTPLQAEVGALCEAIERYSGVFRGDEIRNRVSFEALGEKAIHPNTCMGFSDRQYANREEWNENEPSLARVPHPFNEQAVVDWTPVWSLRDCVFRYLPTAYCYFGYNESEGRKYCGADSNGHAAGNTVEEAILQGFMELAERDCAAIWWYNQLRRPAVDLASFDEPYFEALREYYATLDSDMWVLDITSDLKIPAFAAISRRFDRTGRATLGFGAHFSAELAVSRALTELNQFLPRVSEDTPTTADSEDEHDCS